MTSRRRLRVVVVDDEPPSREVLELLLREDDRVELVGSCADGAAARRVLRETRPDIVFLDVQMPGLDGFELLASLGPGALPPVVVFVTAFDRHAVRAFEASALDFLLKPYSDERFRSVLERAKARVAERELAAVAERVRDLLGGVGESAASAVEPAPREEERLLVRSAGRVAFVEVRDLDWVEAADYCARLHVGSRSYLVRRSLKDLEAALPATRFARVSRGALVNAERVRELRRKPDGVSVLLLEDGVEVPLGRLHRKQQDALMERLFGAGPREARPAGRGSR